MEAGHNSKGNENAGNLHGKVEGKPPVLPFHECDLALSMYRDVCRGARGGGDGC